MQRKPWEENAGTGHSPADQGVGRRGLGAELGRVPVVQVWIVIRIPQHPIKPGTVPPAL